MNICIKNTFPTNHPFSGCVRLLIFLTLISPGSNISLARSSSFDLDHWHLVDALRKDQDLKSASPRGVVVYYGALRLCGFLCWLNRTVERDLVLPLDCGMGCYAYHLLQLSSCHLWLFGPHEGKKSVLSSSPILILKWDFVLSDPDAGMAGWNPCAVPDLDSGMKRVLDLLLFLIQ